MREQEPLSPKNKNMEELPKPVPLSPVEETKMEVDYLKDISNEDKEKYIRGLMEVAGKEFVAAFIGLGLKTHMECMIIEENSKKEFVLSFRPFTEHLKRFPFEETPDLLNSDKNVQGSDTTGSEKTDAAGTQIKQ